MDKNLQKELKRLEKQKAKARNARDLAEEAKLCNVAGELLSGNRLFESAIEEHKKELLLSESINDIIAVAISHRKIGECLCECKDFKNALFHQQKYLELSRKSQDLVEEQRAFATIGRTWFMSANSSADMQKAQSAYLESLSICDQLREIVKEKELLEMRARLYLNLGLVYNNLKNRKKGMKYIEKALGIAVNLSLKDTEYRCHFSLGEIKCSEGQPAKALQCFERARKVAQHQKKKFDEADTLVQMGQVLLSLGDFKGGKNILKKCLKSMQHGNHVQELRSNLIKAIKGTRLLEKLEVCREEDRLIKIFEDLGDLYVQVKCFDKAVDYYLKQFELSEKLNKSNQEKAVICFSIAASYSDNKQYEKAKEYFRKELQLRDGDPPEECDAWLNIAQVSDDAGESYEAIEEAYDNALLCAKKAQRTDKQVRVLKLFLETQRKFAQENRLQETLHELSSLEKCKIEEDSEMEEDDGGMEEDDDDDDDGEELISQEMESSDRESDEEDNEHKSIGRVKRTNAKSIYKRNEKGETVLHCAAIRGDYNLAKTSIEKGVSVDSRDYCGWQPLHEACNHGHLSIVELLLDSGANINDPGGPHCRGMTALHDATLNGHVEVVKYLVSRGASVTLKNKDGHTPLDQVLTAIAEDEENLDDSDDPDTDLPQIRQELKIILRNATISKKTPSRHLPEMKRRYLLDTQDESDEEPHASTYSENSEALPNPSVLSRKRKSALIDLDSDDEVNNTTRRRPEISKKHDGPTIGSKTKVARLARNREPTNLSDSESLSGLSGDGPWTPMGVYDNDVTDSQLTVEITSDLSEEQYDASQQVQGSSESFSQEGQSDDFDSQPLYEEQEHLVPADTVESRLHVWPSRSEPSKTTRPVLGNQQNSSLQNGDTNSGISMTFVDPLTGSSDQELRASHSPALIPENEYVEGVAASHGWLIDDLPKKGGKRKRSSDIRSMLGSSESRKKVPQGTSSWGSSSRGSSSQSFSSRGSSSRGPSSTRRTNSNAGSCLRQSRLSNHVVSGRSLLDGSEDPWSDEAPDCIEPAVSAVGTPRAGNVVSDVSAPMRLRVKVKDKTFLIPCPVTSGDKKTVQWLAEQATFRYYSACGLKPVLSLSTAEGASLSPDDQITDVLSNNEQVVASVESWDLPPLAERYKTACMSAGSEIQKHILEVLQSNTQLASVEFPEMALTPVKLLPLCRALQCHEQLVKLSLPGNRIGDSGFQHLVAALPCLPNLATVILSSNGISHKGLRHLASNVTDNTQCAQTLKGLKELDISFNPVKDIAAPSFATILCSCLHLQKLNIESCYFTESTFQQRSLVIEAISGLTRLRHLKMSHNVIMANGMRPLLNALSNCPMEHLDISYTITKYDPAFAKFLGEYLGKDNCCIQQLVCQSCFLRDADIAMLVRCSAFRETIVRLDLSLNEIGREGAEELAGAMQSSKCPKQLDLSGNVNITSENLLQFLAPATGKSLQRLDLSVCGLASPLPIDFAENPQTLVASKLLKFLNLSHNSIEESDQEKLSQWWNSIWGKHSCVHLDWPFKIFGIHPLTD